MRKKSASLRPHIFSLKKIYIYNLNEDEEFNHRSIHVNTSMNKEIKHRKTENSKHWLFCDPFVIKKKTRNTRYFVNGP